MIRNPLTVPSCLIVHGTKVASFLRLVDHHLPLYSPIGAQTFLTQNPLNPLNSASWPFSAYLKTLPGPSVDLSQLLHHPSWHCAFLCHCLPINSRLSTPLVDHSPPLHPSRHFASQRQCLHNNFLIIDSENLMTFFKFRIFSLKIVKERHL